MTELRPYQRDLLQEAERALAAPKARVMLQLPTGGGKTRIAAALLAGWIRGGGKAAWLTHRRELSDQTSDVLNENGLWAANTLGWGVDDPAPSATDGVVIEMVQTVSKRNKCRSVWGEYGPGDLLVIDEAHHAPARGWERTIRQWPGPAIGLTATPWRIEKNRGFKHLFDQLILGPQISELQGNGSLAYAQVLMPDSDRIILGGRLNPDGEYIREDIELANQGRPNVMTGGALEFWQRYAQDRQTIVYAVSVGHAKNLAAVFKAAGVSADVILGPSNQKPHDRAKVIKQFKDRKLQVLVNVAVATEGFDLPEASCVVLARPTMSLALYLQMVGRGLRPKSDGGNCLILDLAGNVNRPLIGFPNDDREWSLEPRGRLGEGGPPPVVRCPDCERVSPASSHNCQVCGNPFGEDCQWCGQWRARKWWSAETYCCDRYQVCDLCHLDAHKIDKIPLVGEPRELMKEAIIESRIKFDPSKLHTLDAIRQQMREVAQELVYTSWRDRASFDALTQQFSSLLDREKELKRARRKFRAELVSKFGNHSIKLVEEQVGDIDDADYFGSNGRGYFVKTGIRRCQLYIVGGELESIEAWDDYGEG